MPSTSVEWSILLDIRLPRLILGLVSGFILALSGSVFQTVFNNPLADSFSLGLASGASFGSAVAVVLGLSFSMIAVSSIVFSLLTLVLVMVLTHQLFQRHEKTGMVLFGMFINFFFSSALYGLVLLNSDKSRSLLGYLFGSVGAVEWHDIVIVMPVLIIGTGVILSNARAVSILRAGDTTAASLGIHTTSLIYSVLTAASVMTAVTISMTGIIGFVGLIIPQLCAHMNDRFPIKLLWTGITGSLAVIFSDFLGNLLLSPVQIPVSVVLAFLGLPLLLVITIRTVRQSLS